MLILNKAPWSRTSQRVREHSKHQAFQSRTATLWQPSPHKGLIYCSKNVPRRRKNIGAKKGCGLDRREWFWFVSLTTISAILERILLAVDSVEQINGIVEADVNCLTDKEIHRAGMSVFNLFNNTSQAASSWLNTRFQDTKKTKNCSVLPFSPSDTLLQLLASSFHTSLP